MPHSNPQTTAWGTASSLRVASVGGTANPRASNPTSVSDGVRSSRRNEPSTVGIQTPALRRDSGGLPIVNRPADRCFSPNAPSASPGMRRQRPRPAPASAAGPDPPGRPVVPVTAPPPPPAPPRTRRPARSPRLSPCRCWAADQGNSRPTSSARRITLRAGVKQILHSLLTSGRSTPIVAGSADGAAKPRCLVSRTVVSADYYAGRPGRWSIKVDDGVVTVG